MSYDWSWIEELPEWETPEELKENDNPPAYNLAAKILTCRLASNPIRAAVGRYVYEDARLNMWLGGGGQRQPEAKEFLTLAAETQQGVKRIYEAWKALELVIEGSWEGEPEVAAARMSQAETALLESVEESAVYLEDYRHTHDS